MSLSPLFRKHVALPADHGSWVFLLSPLVIGLFAGGRWSAGAAWLVVGVLAAFLIRQPLTLAVKIASGRRGRQDLAAAWFWIAAYGAIGLAALAALVAHGFSYLLLLAIPGVPVLGWFLFLVARRAERRQMPLEILATAVLALAAPAAMWVGLGRPDPRGWLLWALVGAQSVASIVLAYLRLDQRELPAVPPRRERMRMGAAALALAALDLAAVAALGVYGIVPALLTLPYALRFGEALDGTLQPAVGWKPRRIGFRLLWGAIAFTALFVLTWE